MIEVLTAATPAATESLVVSPIVATPTTNKNRLIGKSVSNRLTSSTTDPAYPTLKQIAALEDARSKTLQGILEIQKCFRGYQARCRFYELKRNAITLQSLLRNPIPTSLCGPCDSKPLVLVDAVGVVWWLLEAGGTVGGTVVFIVIEGTIGVIVVAPVGVGNAVSVVVIDAGSIVWVTDVFLSPLCTIVDAELMWGRWVHDGERFARRGGVKRISDLIYEETRDEDGFGNCSRKKRWRDGTSYHDGHSNSWSRCAMVLRKYRSRIAFVEDESEPFRRTVIETIEKVVVNLGASIDARLEELLIDVIRGAKAQNEYQSLIKRWRAALLIQKYMKQKIARRLYGRRTSVTQALSQNMRNMENLSFNSTTADGEPYENTPELKDSKQELVQVPSSVLVELHRRVKNMEAALGQKDEENLVLKQQLKLFETRWSEYEAKMKSMEEMWQRQTESLQISVAAAKKSLAVDETIVQPGRPDAFPMPHSYDSEEATSVGTTTPESITPPKLRSRPSNVTQGRDSNEAFNAVSLVVKELDQRKQTFEDEARFLSEGRLGHPTSTMNPDEEYRKLKHRFEAWKKDYKVRLRETKMKIHKFGSADLDKSRKSWWGMKSMKRS
ncbi:hypothetical protein GIB67_025146 [Kingdonia uniflora]|uniref:Uncharacterized protein n=1 Tax=Kingdonia uniflora TaxID=39325 RepID=A0A7J7N8B6_9MAGN|nr:hypothetical protein GIB67_025146 [Kingdonia uniflora]